MQIQKTLYRLSNTVLLCAAAAGAHAEVLDFSDNPSGHSANEEIHSGAYTLFGGARGVPGYPIFEIDDAAVTLVPGDNPRFRDTQLLLWRDLPAAYDYRYFQLIEADIGIAWSGTPDTQPADWKNEVEIVLYSYMQSVRYTFTVGGIDALTHIVLPEPNYALQAQLLAPEGAILRIANINVLPNSPVPEPSAWMMWAAGLAATGGLAWQRRKRAQGLSTQPA